MTNHEISNIISSININRMITILSLLISVVAIGLALLALSPIQIMFPQGTGSMEPLLDDGDEIVIVDTHVRADELDTGEVIVFESYCPDDTDMLIHKIVSNGDNGIRTSGISSDAIDQELNCRPEISDQSLTGRAFLIFEL